MREPSDRRAELLHKVADHVLAQGIATASLRPMAAAAGVSDRMLLYYFKDKGELVAAALAELMGRLQGELEAALPPARLAPEPLAKALFELATGEALWPYMRLWLEIAALAARGDPLCRPVGEAIARGMIAWLIERLDVASPSDAEAQALDLVIGLEGRLVLHSVGVRSDGLR
jgi:AcrR family transcriptional regulator